MKEKNYKEARKFFEKYAKEGDLYSMYKFAKINICGLGGDPNYEEIKYYFDLSKNKGFIKSELYLMTMDKLSNNITFTNLPDRLIQNFFIMQIIRYNLNRSIAIDKHNLLTNKEIKMKFKDTQLIFTSKYYRSSYFKDVLKSFEEITIEVLFPSESYPLILERVASLKQKSIHKINICIYISDVSGDLHVSSNYKSYKYVTNVIIGPSIKIIWSSAFDKFKSLAIVTIPSSVTEIKASSFANCSSLAQIVIPSSVTMIGGWAFYNCSSLAQIVIPSSVISIENNAFHKCSALTQISIPSSVTKIGYGAFSKCTSLREVELLSSITSIEKKTFKECTSLDKIVIPTSVVSFFCNFNLQRRFL